MMTDDKTHLITAAADDSLIRTGDSIILNPLVTYFY